LDQGALTKLQILKVSTFSFTLTIEAIFLISYNL